MTNAKEAAERLRLLFIQARQSSGLGVRELARKSGIAPSTICSIEKHRRSLSLDMACRLFDSMDIELKFTTDKRGEP